ncbi:MAG: M23 family metallopeptidase [Clostridium sp.]|nr:M23 family metallopeptidase [Acetatifactor muris]MCM1564001.1 M23 family metallopeptidase [Clostridium sp.]
MNLRTKKIKFTYVRATILTLFICMFFVDGYKTLESDGENYFHIVLNGEEIGVVGRRDEADLLLAQARREIAAGNEGLTFIEADMSVTGEEVLWGALDDGEVLCARMGEVLREHVQENLHQAYTLKVNEYMVNLSSMEDVQSLLQAAIDKYDSEGNFQVELVRDEGRALGTLTVRVTQREDSLTGQGTVNYVAAGVETVMMQIDTETYDGREKGFEDFDYGLKSMNFAEEVEIVEAYLPESQLFTLDRAVEEVIKDQEVPGEYVIVSGDTLSEIAIKVNIPVDKIIELNSDKLEDEKSTIRAGDKLIITVPEPELSVERVEENYYEESYNADIIYIENDDWYTNQTKVHVQPSAGFRKAVAQVHYLNDREVSREILKEEIVKEAVAKVVERGTKIPPTYIRPISGGRQTSGFGRRKAPTKGASTYHKGVDWAVPTGTAVYASCGGTVAKAGWGSGYGYVVYINHEDGRQTRYGHLSKVLVSAGQSVKQGEKIALSGNTGVSTGPHLHFEILINGSQVNPLNYLE